MVLLERIHHLGLWMAGILDATLYFPTCSRVSEVHPTYSERVQPQLLISVEKIYNNMMLAWPGSEREASDDFFFFCSDQKINCIKLLRFQTVAKSSFCNRFKIAVKG